MSQVQIKFVAIVFLFLIPCFVSGQKIRFYSSEQGLPNSQIQNLSQDKEGYIWIATGNGASYFDGMRFTSFHHQNTDLRSLSNDLVKAIYTDSRGVCWIATANGLQIFDHNTNSFRDFSLQYPSFTGTPYITSIAESLDKKIILVSVAGLGVLAYDAVSHQIDLDFTHRLGKKYGNKYPGILFVDSKDLLWSYSEQGSFFAYNLESQSIQQLKWSSDLNKIKDHIVVSSITEDPVSHNILIGTYKHGILVFDQVIGLIRKTKSESCSKYKIRALLAEKQIGYENRMNIWVGTEDDGLKIFDPENENITNPDFQYAHIDLNKCKVHSLMQDNQGNTWAGIFQKGLLIIPKAINNFEYIKLSATTGTMSVNVACATSIIRDESNNLWVGTDGGGLFKISEDGVKTQYTKENSKLPNNSILTLTIDKHGTIWITTYMGGITKYSPNEGFSLFNTHVELQKIICSEYDKISDKIYFGTLGHSVKVFSISTNTIESYTLPRDVKWVNSLKIDHSRNLWVGSTEGILCINPDSEENIYTELNKKINGSTINAILEDTNFTMWFGTSNGLFYYSEEVDELKHYSQVEGLAGNIICSIQQSNDDLWLSTLNGISQFSIKHETFKNFYVYDGLQDNEFRTRATHKDPDQKLFFGGINGVTAFYPQDINIENDLHSKLYFSNLTVLNELVNYNEELGEKNILDSHISQANQITLKNNENVFSLEFTVLEYANPQKVVYGYMLKGFDDDWQYTNSNQRLATYTNLPDGAYIFQVKAFFEGCNNNQSIYKDINIKILPPWYKTWWAYLIYLTLTMFSVWEFLNLLIRRRLHIRERLELEKKEMKLRMLTDISHEIRTPLSLVISPLKSMQELESDPKRIEMFNLMYRNVMRVLRLLNQLMDVRKIDNQQLKMHFQKTDLLFFLQDIMKSFDQLAIMRNIDLRLISNMESLEVWIDQANFDKVIFNVLSNAFKFTPENGFILISINTICSTDVTDKKLLYNGDYIELCIKNTGNKIPEVELERIFERFYQSKDNLHNSGSGIGLHLAQKIAHLHYGNIKANNVENGVAFSVFIPIGNNHLAIEDISETVKSKTSNSGINENVNQQEVNHFENISTNLKIINTKKSKTKHTLILVDDDYDFGKYLQEVLSDIYCIDFYTSATEAWKEISTTLPDLVITDLVMPELNGKSFCEKIKNNPETNHIPIVILTSKTDENSERLCIESGVDHYLIKPINIELLKSTIDQIIQTRNVLRNKYRSNINVDLDDIKITSPDSLLVSKVIETIRLNIENPEFSVDELSRAVGLSRAHFNRKLKENINITPLNLIKSIRLKQAAFLLVNNKVNISDVAYKVGFSSHSYFSNNFKEYFGMSPKEFVLKNAESVDRDNLKKLFEN